MRFLAQVLVRLFEPMAESQTDEAIIGYWQIIGVQAESKDEAVMLLEQLIADGEIARLRIGKPTLKKPPDEITRSYESAGIATIWYRSGRAFFSDEAAFKES